MEITNQFVDDYMKDLYTRLGFNNDNSKNIKKKTNYNLSKIKKKLK